MFGLGIDLWHDQVSAGPYEFPGVFTGSAISVDVVQGEPWSRLWTRGNLILRTDAPIAYRTALDVAHGLEALSGVVPFCLEAFADLEVLPISDAAVTELAGDWSKARVAQFAEHEIVEVFGDVGQFRFVPSMTHIPEPESLAGLMPLVRRYVEEQRFARGVSYLRESMRSLGVDSCDWAGEGFDLEYYRYVPLGAAESAFLNAFKSVEAIVGEPGRDRTARRFRERITEQGISPDEEVGYGGMKEPLVDKVLRYHAVRDDVAAHGLGRSKRDLALREILDLQRLGRYLLLKKPTLDVRGIAPAVRTQDPRLDAL